MQELMSRHKAYALNPRDCLKTTLFQKWQKMVAPPGKKLSEIFLFLFSKDSKKVRLKGLCHYMNTKYLLNLKIFPKAASEFLFRLSFSVSSRFYSRDIPHCMKPKYAKMMYSTFHPCHWQLLKQFLGSQAPYKGFQEGFSSSERGFSQKLFKNFELNFSHCMLPEYINKTVGAETKSFKILKKNIHLVTQSLFGDWVTRWIGT